jgi:peptide/nickel transport system substrate-binding protein
VTRCFTASAETQLRKAYAMNRRALGFIAALTAVALNACDKPGEGESDQPSGTLVIAALADPNSLFPPLVNVTSGRQITEQIYQYLTEVDTSLNTTSEDTFAKRLLQESSWAPDSSSLIVRIRNDARWQDGQPVQSDDIIYSFAVYTGKAVGSSTAPQLAAIDSVTRVDSMTVRFWLNKRYPLAFYDATSQMQILPKHIFGGIAGDIREAQSGIKPVGSGRFHFVSWKHGESVEIAADTLARADPARIGRVVWRIFPTVDAAVTALLAGEVDVFDAMRPQDVAAASKGNIVRVVTGPGADYAFMAFNMKEPSGQSAHHLFASKEIRRALTMAVDRQSMVRNVFGDLARVAVGPTITAFPSTDTANLHQLPYDPSAAAHILDSLGWHPDPASGVRKKDGVPLKFSVISPISSANRHRMSVLLQEQLRKIGVEVVVDEMDYSAMMTRAAAHDFDAAMLSWHLGTSPASIRELWTGKSAAGDGNNFGSWVNPRFDADVDSAVNAVDPERSKEYYTRAYQIAIDDAPAVWLYEPKMVLGVNKRVHTAPMRADAWWFSLGDWYIPKNEMIGRDRIHQAPLKGQKSAQ